MLEVTLLGQFSIRLNGRSIEFSSRPAQSLFAYLILNRGIQHRRERLAGLLWPDSTEASARNNLRQALWRIRRSLGPAAGEFIHADRFHASFNPDAEYWLDVRALEAQPAPNASADEWVQVASAYGGELLPGFYEDWVVLERERIELLKQRRFDGTVERLAEAGRWSELLEWAERWIGFGGVPEAAYRAAMLAHFQLGDVGRAVAAYDRLKASLEDELGVPPSDETEQLLARIKSGQGRRPARPPPAELPTPEFLSADRERSDRRPLFARQRELAELEQQLERALASGGRIAMITGEAGSGKTALLLEFVRRAHQAHDLLLTGKGDSNALTGPDDPYLPFRGVLGCLMGDIQSSWEGGTLTTQEAHRAWSALPDTCRALLDRGEGLVGSLLSLGWLAPVAPSHRSMPPELVERIQRLAAVEQSGRRDPVLSQSGVFAQFADVLVAIAEERPLLLALDDLQWADVGSIDLLFYLARRLTHSPILILGAYRSEELGYRPDHPLTKLVAELKTTFGQVELDLARSENLLFVEQLIDSEPNRLPPSFRHSLHRQTRGHPLFTIELLRAMQARGDLVLDSHGRWEQGPSLDWQRLPSRVEGVLVERLSRVDADLRQLLNVACVEGETFTAELVAQVVDRDQREVIHALSQQLDKLHRLVEAHLVQWVNGQRLSKYRFRHVLFQRQLYEQLDPVERSFLHARVGTTLEALHSPEVDRIAVRLAHHFAESGDVVKSVHYLRAAAGSARRVSANAEAVDHLRRALSLLDGFPEGPARIENELVVQLGLGSSLIASEGYASPQVRAAYARARQLCAELGETQQLFPAVWGLWSFHTIQAAHGIAHELARQLRQLADRDPALELEARRALGTTLLYLGEIREARGHLERGVELYRPKEHADHAYQYGQNPLVSSLINLALTLWLQGYPDQALQRIEAAVSSAQQIGHPHSLAYALLMAASLHSSRREWERTLARADQAIEVADRHGFPLWIAASTILRGAALAQLSRGQGVQVIREGLEKWERLGAGLGLPHYLGLLAKTLASSGEPARGLARVEQALQIALDHQELVHLAELHRIRGDLLLQLGRSNKEAQAALKQSVAAAKRMRSLSMELRAVIGLSHLRLAQGHRHTHRDMLSRALSRFTEGFDTPDLVEAKQLMQR